MENFNAMRSLQALSIVFTILVWGVLYVPIYPVLVKPETKSVQHPPVILTVDWLKSQVYKVRKGDSYSKIYRRLGISKFVNREFRKQIAKNFPRRIYPGQRLFIEALPYEKKIRSFSIESKSGSLYHMMTWQGEKWEYGQSPLELVTDTVKIAALGPDFEESLEDIGEPAELFHEICEIFFHTLDTNMLESPHTARQAEFLVEKKFDQFNQFRGYGPILSARLDILGKDFWAFRYGEDGNYFDPNGSNYSRPPLAKPLDVMKIASHFSYGRLHPVLNKYMPHLGVDYSAPYGTPVKAVSDGMVEYTKWIRGYGKTIKVVHDNGYNTYYAHLKKYTVKSGDPVSLGQVIGKVGSTGRTSGPHLDYRVEKDGRFLNPEKIYAARAKTISKKDWPFFVQNLNSLQLRMGYFEVNVAKVGEDIDNSNP